MRHDLEKCNTCVYSLMNAIDMITTIAEKLNKEDERQQAEKLKQTLCSTYREEGSVSPDLVETIVNLAAIVMPKSRLIVDGCHAGILFGDVGYEELDDPQMAMDKLFDLIGHAIRCDAGFSLDWGMSTVEELSRMLPDDVTRLRAILNSTDRIEILNGSYSQPFPMTIGWESNIRQFEEGLRCAQKILGAKPRVYAAQEFGHHPQMPQILKGYGFEGCSLRVRLNGEVPLCDSPIVYWEGDDGTAMPCLTTLETVPTCDECSGLFYKSLASGFASLEKSDAEAGVFSNLEDVVYPVSGREQAMECPRRDEILGRFCTYSEAFEALKDTTIQTVEFQSAHFRPHVFQNSQLFVATRNAETSLVVSETLDTYAYILGIELGLAPTIHEAWRSLLAAENHDSYVVPEHTPGTYTVERASIFGPYRGLRSDKTVGEKGMELASDATRACSRTIDRFKVAISSEISRKIAMNNAEQGVGRPDLDAPAGNACHPILLMDVTGLGGRKAAIGKLDFPMGEMDSFHIEPLNNDVKWQIVHEKRWADGSLRSAHIAVQADVAAFGWIAAVLRENSKPSANIGVKPCSSNQERAIASISGDTASVDTGATNAKLTPGSTLNIELSDQASGKSMACIQIPGLTDESNCSMVANGPVIGAIQVEQEKNGDLVAITCSAFKNESSVHIQQTHTHKAQHEYIIRSSHKIKRVLADYPFGLGEITPGVFHALNVVVIESEEGRLCVVHNGDPYFEYIPEQDAIRYAPRHNSSSIRVFVLHDDDNPLELARSCMFDLLILQPPHVDINFFEANNSELNGKQVSGTNACSGRIVDFRGNVIISSLRRTEIDEVEIRAFNPSNEERGFSLKTLPEHGIWRETGLDGTKLNSGCCPCSSETDSEQTWILPPRRIATFRCNHYTSGASSKV